MRVNAFAPGPIETGMLNRFTGTGEAKAALASGVPLGRVGAPEEIGCLIGTGLCLTEMTATRPPRKWLKRETRAGEGL